MVISCTCTTNMIVRLYLSPSRMWRLLALHTLKDGRAPQLQYLIYQKKKFLIKGRGGANVKL